MSYENIEIEQSNFCIGPQAGAYYTLTNIGTHYVVYIKNNTGLLVDTYTLGPVDAIDAKVDYSIRGFKYIGPINQLNPANGLIFYSLESIEYINCENCNSRLRIDVDSDITSCPVCYQNNIQYLKEYPEMTYYISFIKKWVMDDDLKVFNLYSTIEKVSNVINNYNAVGFAIETIDTEFKDDSVTNTGYVNLTTVSGIQKYDTMVLGPSTDTDNLNGVEYVSVHSVSDPKVEITTMESYIPTKYEYAVGDGVTIIKYIYLMCKSKNISNDMGYLYKLDPNDYGNIVETNRKYEYNFSTAVVWSKLYNAVAFVYNSQLLFTKPSINYLYSTSVQLFNYFEGESYTIYDIDVIDTSFYMLQRNIVKRIDGGGVLSFSWENYNYSVESVLPSTHNVAIFSDPSVLMVGNNYYITITVTDQFGIVLANKNIVFTKNTEFGIFDPIDGVGLTNSNGEFTIKYTLTSALENEYIIISARVDGAATHLGSGYVWTSINLFIYYSKEVNHLIDLRPYKDFGIEADDWWPQRSAHAVYLYSFNKYERIGGFIYALSFSFHMYPGGANNTVCVEQGGIRFGKSNDADISYVNHSFCIQSPIKTIILDCLGAASDTLFLDSLAVSRHFSNDVNKTSVDIYQFSFVSEAHPKFYSYKNPYNTYIWILLRPYAFSLNKNTLVFKIKESSYAGDTGWIDITSSLIVKTIGAPPSPLGLDIMWDNIIEFHNNGVVTVHIEVYDGAPTPNKIEITYWFVIVPDYLKPYVENEYPTRNSIDVSINTQISFNIVDLGSGIDIESIEVYIKGRQVRNLNIVNIEHGVYVWFDPEILFMYSDVIDIAVYAQDKSDNSNSMVDKWVLYCEKSIPPWFNDGSFLPVQCSQGIIIRPEVSLQVYGVGGGVDFNDIEFAVDDTKRNALITPIIYRIE